jgi:hypothetical protein
METKLEAFRERADVISTPLVEKTPPRNMTFLQAMVKISHRRSSGSITAESGSSTPVMEIRRRSSAASVKYARLAS